jgi:GNAT superfamily N-acetyltransferase
VVYYPHLLVHPDYQGKGIGKMIFDKMQEKYSSFHMQMLTANGKAIDFYKKMVLNTQEKRTDVDLQRKRTLKKADSFQYLTGSKYYTLV